MFIFLRYLVPGVPEMWAEKVRDLTYSKATQELISCWYDLPRAEGAVCPKRSDFSSIRIGAFLAEVFISEWKDHDTLQIIQAGTKLDRLLGQDITGLNIFELLPPELLEEERSYYSLLRDTPCAGMITRHAKNLKNQPFVYRTMQLPMLDPRGNIQYFVGTGVALSAVTQLEEFGALNDDNIELLERKFFDIGAGVPQDVPCL